MTRCQPPIAGFRCDRAAGALLFLLAAALTACGPRNFANDKDMLRRANADLRDRVHDLEASIALRVSEIDELHRRLGPTPTHIDGAEPPRLARLVFGRYRAAVDTDGDGDDDLARIYVRPLDQHRRFLPVAGRAVVQATRLVPDGPPGTLAERTYAPAELDAAYRSGLTGTHYTLELPLTQPLPPGLQQITVAVYLYDADTGTMKSHQQAIAVRARPASGAEGRTP